MPEEFWRLAVSNGPYALLLFLSLWFAAQHVWPEVKTALHYQRERDTALSERRGNEYAALLDRLDKRDEQIVAMYDMAIRAFTDNGILIREGLSEVRKAVADVKSSLDRQTAALDLLLDRERRPFDE